MPFFSQAKAAQLYLGADSPGDQGHVAVVLPKAGPSGFEIADAITSATYNATIVFLQQPIGTDPAVQQSFVTDVLNLVAKVGASRMLLWTPNAASVATTAQPI